MMVSDTSYVFLLFLNLFFGPQEYPLYKEYLGDYRNMMTLYVHPTCSLTWLMQPHCPFTPSNKDKNLTTCSENNGICWENSQSIPPSDKIICPSCRYVLHINLLKIHPNPLIAQVIENDPRCNHRLPRNNPKSYQTFKEVFNQSKHQKRPIQRKKAYKKAF